MKKLHHQPSRVLLTALLMLLALAGAAIAMSGREQAASPAELQLLKQFKAVGKDASLTVLPVRLGAGQLKQIGEVVGLLLERSGMGNIEIGSVKFEPPADADPAQLAKALAEFVKAHPPATSYVLFADFVVSPQRKFSEISGVIVNKDGAVVWQDRLTERDAAFKRANPKEPMQCCMLLVDRLRPVLKLDDPNRKGAPEGRIAELWRQKSGLPDKTELAAMRRREQAFKKAGAKATLLVYPARTGDDSTSAGGAHLASLINNAHLANATSAAQGPKFDLKRDMNEQKTLWEMARALRDHVRKHPPEADYVLFADYLMQKQAVAGVHFVICDRQGDWVVVDFQNDHHDEFKKVKPRSSEDCDRLVTARLKSYCR